MADDKVAVICANPDCRVAEGGRCVEGFEVDACPHYGRAPEVTGDSDANGGEGAVSAMGIELPGADTLTPAEASRLLCAGAARIIAIVGPREAGKTSLIASLYDLFQNGAVSGIEFARSQTLHAFERACHDVRAASRRGVPHTHRTPRGEVRFYHLEIGGGQAGDGLSLILGDRAGEEYIEAADDASVLLAFPEIRRADTLTVLVDGKRLLDSGVRHNLRSEITMTLQALVDGGATQVGHRLALVLTKIDLVRESPLNVRAEADFDALAENIRRIFGDVFSVIEQFRIAASPKENQALRGTGVPDLLEFWLEPTPPVARTRLTFPVPSRAFARLLPLEYE